MRVRVTRRNNVHRGPRRLGQALVETAIAAPFLVMLLLGGAQVGSVSYDQVSLDTAAREGARAGAAAPGPAVTSYPSGTVWYPGQSTYSCQSGDFTSSASVNPICAGVYTSAGLLDKTKFTSGAATVTIKVVPPAGSPGGLARATGSPSARVAATQSCNPGKYAELTGNVTFPSGQTQGLITDTAGDSLPIDTSSSPYIFCVTTNSKGTLQTVTAVSPPTANCGGYTWSVNLPVAYPGQIFTYDISFSAEPSCPTSTNTTTSTTTSSSSSTTSTATSSSSSSSTTLTITSNPACTTTLVPDQYYFTVSVTYPAPIFVPFINQLFQTSPGVRTVTSTVTYPIEPCTMTNPK